MKRYSQGMERPKWKVDIFTGEIACIFGEIDCTLSETPKGTNIFVQVEENVGGDSAYTFWFQQLVGRVVTVAYYKMRFEKPDTPTGTTDAAGGGAVGEPHSHALTFSYVDMDDRPYGLFNSPPIRILYELA